MSKFTLQKNITVALIALLYLPFGILSANYWYELNSSNKPKYKGIEFKYDYFGEDIKQTIAANLKYKAQQCLEMQNKNCIYLMQKLSKQYPINCSSHKYCIHRNNLLVTDTKCYDSIVSKLMAQHHDGITQPFVMFSDAMALANEQGTDWENGSSEPAGVYNKTIAKEIYKTTHGYKVVQQLKAQNNKCIAFDKKRLVFVKDCDKNARNQHLLLSRIAAENFYNITDPTGSLCLNIPDYKKNSVAKKQMLACNREEKLKNEHLQFYPIKRNGDFCNPSIDKCLLQTALTFKSNRKCLNIGKKNLYVNDCYASSKINKVASWLNLNLMPLMAQLNIGKECITRKVIENKLKLQYAKCDAKNINQRWLITKNDKNHNFYHASDLSGQNCLDSIELENKSYFKLQSCKTFNAKHDASLRVILSDENKNCSPHLEQCKFTWLHVDDMYILEGSKQQHKPSRKDYRNVQLTTGDSCITRTSHAAIRATKCDPANTNQIWHISNLNTEDELYTASDPKDIYCLNAWFGMVDDWHEVKRVDCRATKKNINNQFYIQSPIGKDNCNPLHEDCLIRWNVGDNRCVNNSLKDSRVRFLGCDVKNTNNLIKFKPITSYFHVQIKKDDECISYSKHNGQYNLNHTICNMQSNKQKWNVVASNHSKKQFVAQIPKTDICIASTSEKKLFLKTCKAKMSKHYSKDVQFQISKANSHNTFLTTCNPFNDHCAFKFADTKVASIMLTRYPIDLDTNCLAIVNEIKSNRLQKVTCFTPSALNNTHFKITGLQINLANDKHRCLELANGKTTDGTKVIVAPCNNRIGQKFAYYKGTIAPILNKNKCLTANMPTTDIELRQCQNDKAQLFNENIFSN